VSIFSNVAGFTPYRCLKVTALASLPLFRFPCRHDSIFGVFKQVYSKKSRKEGLLSFENDLDQAKINARDIFEYGLSFVIDGVDWAIIEEILTNIIKQEKDEDMIILKNIQKDAVWMIQAGLNPRLLYAVLNSHTGITLQEEKIQKQWEIEQKGE
jgi:flagellar motor component MotA